MPVSYPVHQSRVRIIRIRTVLDLPEPVTEREHVPPRPQPAVPRAQPCAGGDLDMQAPQAGERHRASPPQGPELARVDERERAAEHARRVAGRERPRVRPHGVVCAHVDAEREVLERRAARQRRERLEPVAERRDVRELVGELQALERGAGGQDGFDGAKGRRRRVSVADP